MPKKSRSHLQRKSVKSKFRPSKRSCRSLSVLMWTESTTPRYYYFLIFLEYVFQLLQKIWQELKCLELCPQGQIVVFNGNVSDMLPFRLSQGILLYYNFCRENAREPLKMRRKQKFNEVENISIYSRDSS